MNEQEHSFLEYLDMCGGSAPASDVVRPGQTASSRGLAVLRDGRWYITQTGMESLDGTV